MSEDLAGSKIGRYEVVSEIGRGTAGVVYKAYDSIINRSIAIKAVQRGGIDESEYAQALGRFKREAQIAGRLNHPNVVSIFDFGEHGDVAFMAMEFVEGRTVKDLIGKGEKFTPEQVLVILDALLAALQYAHQKDVVHRDIKPANVLMSAFGTLKLTDFGIARIESADATQGGEMLGTPFYMAPEQIVGKPVDRRADIYSAAVVFYELLTQKKPYRGKNLTELMYAVINTDAEPPSKVDPAWAAFDPVMRKALHKNPERRYQSAAELGQALRRAASGAALGAGVAEAAAPAAREGQGGAPGDPLASVGAVEKRTYYDKDMIFEEGTHGREAFFVVEGLVDIVKQVEGQKVTIACLGPGEVFGEMALLDNTFRMASAQARGVATLAVIEGQILRDRVGRADPIVRALLGRTVSNLRQLTDKVLLLERHGKK
ncbi:MAG: protein kinase [Alphaproteobacteria bacterium]|nr:protein kinase [Alphaproteobacteria bacterium]